METVEPTTLPELIPVTLREATCALAPEDKLDQRERSGKQLSAEDKTELQARRVRAVRVALECARLAGAPADHLEQIKAWLERPDRQRAQAVEDYLAESELTEKRYTTDAQGKQIEHLVKHTTNLGEKAAYYALKATFARHAGGAASYAFECAMAMAKALETSQGIHGGEAHQYVMGVIRAAAGSPE